ncbi:cysteine-rich venom protein ENH1-like [Chrysoperla carnea]|uniref:cysteine-rich venom protein ENH1-like n=1 Tax=Chrysoperla carnea TaxID=189513 RepID=UPI001D085088|nr:cysteine-rich venom protein ENH1-like [Chrysoperla carnea]
MYLSRVLIVLISLSSVYTKTNNDKRNFDTRKNKRIQNRIVGIHNYFRSKVQPTASNMLALSWSVEAANMAQKHADACEFGRHSTIELRKSNKFKQCGESLSIYDVRDPRADWLNAIKLWYDEKSLFQYGGNLTWLQQNFLRVGHYTTLMWATTSHVGCAYARCSNDTTNTRRNFSFHNFVCAYCPIGNDSEYINKPYKKGKACADCPNHCFQKTLCLNRCPVYNNYGPKYCNKEDGDLFRWYPDGCKDKYVREQCKATCRCGKSRIYW